ncbi:MAG: acetate--CoA ligase family protein, partial [Desulfobacula sp.]
MNRIDIEKWIEEGLSSSSKSLTEDRAKTVFRGFNIPVVDEKRETTEEGVLASCRTTGFPVVLKGIGNTVLHKTEKGLVRVGLNTPDEVRRAVKEM